MLGESMTDGPDDGHGSGLERERAHSHLWRRVNEHPDVGTVKQRAPLDWEADGAPVQAHAGMLTQEGVKQRSPPRVREAPLESDPRAWACQECVGRLGRRDRAV